MSSITNEWIALIAFLSIVTLAVALAVFVMMIVNLTKVKGIAQRARGVASGDNSASASAITTVVEGLKSENALLKSKLHFEQSARESAESRAESAEHAAASAASVTRAQIQQGVDKARAREFAELQEKVRGVELHNMALHQECADLRAQLAKTGKRAAANNSDLSETEQLLEKASRSLIVVSKERDASQREIAILRLEIENLKAEISGVLPRPRVTDPHVVPETPVTPQRTTFATKASPAEPKAPIKSKAELKTTAKAKPAIVRRTSSAATTGVSEFDVADKQWNANEDIELLTAYLASRNLAATADALRVDQKQVALRIIVLLLGPHGVIDDPNAPEHGKTYSAADSKAIVQAWRDGRKLPAIARDFKRDQLGIGWKLLDHPTRPVELTADMIPDIVDEVHR